MLLCCWAYLIVLYCPIYVVLKFYLSILECSVTFINLEQVPLSLLLLWYNCNFIRVIHPLEINSIW